MTDWWANINERNTEVCRNNFSAMVKAQNDLYMVCADGSKNDDNTIESLENGTLCRSEFQRSALNICEFLLGTNAMKRLAGEDCTVKVINRPEEESDESTEVIFYKLDNTLELDLTEICTNKGKNYSFALTVETAGYYNITITASSESSELAQIPVTLFCMGTASGTFTWNGTGGKPVSFTTYQPMFSHFTAVRLYFAQSGLKMHSIRFELANTDPEAFLQNG